jgi:hypothetical protein
MYFHPLEWVTCKTEEIIAIRIFATQVSFVSIRGYGPGSILFIELNQWIPFSEAQCRIIFFGWMLPLLCQHSFHANTTKFQIKQRINVSVEGLHYNTKRVSKYIVKMLVS